MKTQSDKKLHGLQDLGSGRWYYHYNEKEVENEDGHISYEYDTLTFSKFPDVDELIIRLPMKEHSKTKSILIQQKKKKKKEIEGLLKEIG